MAHRVFHVLPGGHVRRFKGDRSWRPSRWRSDHAPRWFRRATAYERTARQRTRQELASSQEVTYYGHRRCAVWDWY